VELRGRVAVVTGGASGIGLALCRALLSQGMRVVVADVEEGALADAIDGLAQRIGTEPGTDGAEVSGQRTDVSDYSSVQALADEVYLRHGACHLLCNNAGVGAPSASVWTTTPNDWQWVLGVNLMGVVHGILAFVPRMIEGGEEGHVVNTSSSDGGIAPLPTASVYAASKAGVSTVTECLAAQLAAEKTSIGASVFYPSGGLLRTGLWTADRNRPASLIRETPRTTEPMTPERLEEMAAQGGRELEWQPLDELADLVVRGVLENRYVIMKGIGDSAATLHARADAFGQAQLPTSLHFG
jgi:NAD(P)-dependent dehydrogenase (short-subunit alcohol dehydrogenase family)